MSPDRSPDGHGGNLAAWAERLGCNAAELVDFSVSLNPLGPPPDAVEAARASLADPARYPAPTGDALRRALADRHEVAPDCIWLGAGTTDLVYRLAQLTAVESAGPWSALVPGPTFSEYARACAAAGGDATHHPLGAAPPTSSSHAIGFLCRPNSPGGELPDLQGWRGADVGRWVIDEAFADLASDAPSTARIAATDSSLVALRALTKTYACPWLRVGYLVATPAIVVQLRRLSPPWSVSGPAQAFALAALKDTEYLAASRLEVARLRERLVAALVDVPGVRARPSVANFLALEVADADALQHALAQRGLIVRNCVSFAGMEREQVIRVGLRAWPDLERLVAALAELT